jgi:NAD(P)-dependent dehydrogenase (short-subunit alcohol dehydrogenase family)
MSTGKKVAIVTGASQGIGAGILQAFRDRDYRVVATSRSMKPVADADVATVQGDIGSADTAEKIFKTALERFGRVDTLVNNAGMFMAKPFTLYSPDDYAIYMSTNVTGFFHMTQRALEFMGQQGRGHVLTITTSLVDQPMSSVPAVLASLTKGALSAATRALAIEYAKTGVRINAVSPGNNQDADAPARSASGAGGAPSNGSDGKCVRRRRRGALSGWGGVCDRGDSSRRRRASCWPPHCAGCLARALSTASPEDIASHWRKGNTLRFAPMFSA